MVLAVNLLLLRATDCLFVAQIKILWIRRISSYTRRVYTVLRVFNNSVNTLFSQVLMQPMNVENLEYDVFLSLAWDRNTNCYTIILGNFDICKTLQ